MLYSLPLRLAGQSLCSMANNITLVELVGLEGWFTSASHTFCGSRGTWRTRCICLELVYILPPFHPVCFALKCLQYRLFYFSDFAFALRLLIRPCRLVDTLFFLFGSSDSLQWFDERGFGGIHLKKWGVGLRVCFPVASSGGVQGVMFWIGSRLACRRLVKPPFFDGAHAAKSHFYHYCLFICPLVFGPHYIYCHLLRSHLQPHPHGIVLSWK